MVNGTLFWVFVASNVFVLFVGGSLTLLSAAAYRRRGDRTFVYGTLGFGTVTAGSILELLYELLVKQSQELTTADVLALRTGESVIVGVGLLLLFYSLVGPIRT